MPRVTRSGREYTETTLASEQPPRKLRRDAFSQTDLTMIDHKATTTRSCMNNTVLAVAAIVMGVAGLYIGHIYAQSSLTDCYQGCAAVMSQVGPICGNSRSAGECSTFLIKAFENITNSNIEAK